MCVVCEESSISSVVWQTAILHLWMWDPDTALTGSVSDDLCTNMHTNVLLEVILQGSGSAPHVPPGVTPQPNIVLGDTANLLAIGAILEDLCWLILLVLRVLGKCWMDDREILYEMYFILLMELNLLETHNPFYEWKINTFFSFHLHSFSSLHFSCFFLLKGINNCLYVPGPLDLFSNSKLKPWLRTFASVHCLRGKKNKLRDIFRNIVCRQDSCLHFHTSSTTYTGTETIRWRLYPEICSLSHAKNVWRKTVWCILEKGSFSPSSSLSWQRLHALTQELRDLKKWTCHGKLPAWSWVQTALFGWRDALEPIWIKRCDIRKAYFHRQGSKYVLSALGSERLLNSCLQCE